MSDPIASNSTIPLPRPQTLDGKAIVKGETQRTDSTAAAKQDAFKDYLDQTSITVVKKQDNKAQADAADLLDQLSVYKQPGQGGPL